MENEYLVKMIQEGYDWLLRYLTGLIVLKLANVRWITQMKILNRNN